MAGWLTWLAARIGKAAVAVSLVAWGAGPAVALELAEIAGWWVVVDPNFDRLGELRVAYWQEFVVIDAEGRVEDRAIRFSPWWACDSLQICSGVPLLARARLSVTGGRLRVVDRVEADDALLNPAMDSLVRKMAFTGWPAGVVVDGPQVTPGRASARIDLELDPGGPSWIAQLEDGKRRLELRASDEAAPAKALLRIERDRLRRLWAGYQYLFETATDFLYDAARADLGWTWRCYLRTAMAADPILAAALDELVVEDELDPENGPDQAEAAVASPAPPGFLDDYLRAASYFISLQSMAERPTADLSESEHREFEAIAHELLSRSGANPLIEPFDDILPPRTKADTERLSERVQRVFLLVNPPREGDSATVKERGTTTGEIALTEAEITALGRVHAFAMALGEVFEPHDGLGGRE